LLSAPDTQGLTVDLRDVSWPLAELTPEQRDTVLLAGEGLSIQEGAARLAILEATFRSRVSQGRLRLRQLVEVRQTPLLPAERTKAKSPFKHRQPRNWEGFMIG
jgi:DNA-directed RNA polymerase specialized sigma24 family protein